MRENLRGIHRIEPVVGTAKITTHLHLPLLGQNGLHLGHAQAAQHARHPLTGAAARKARPVFTRLGHKAGVRLFPEQAVQDGVGIQRQQFIALQAGRQDGDAVVIFVAANFILVGLRCAAATLQVGLTLDGQALYQQGLSWGITR